MDNISNSLKFLKKNRISIISVLAIAVALCCIFAFAGNHEEVAADDHAEEANVAETVNAAPAALGGYGVYVDGYMIAAVSNTTDADEAFEEELSARVSLMELDASAESRFVNTINYVAGEYAAEYFVDKSELSALISGDVTAYNGEPLPVKLSVSSVVSSVETVVIKHGTKTVYTDSMRDGAEKTLSEGFDGEGEETKSVTYVDGVETDSVVSLEVTTAAVDEVVQIGTLCDTYSVANNIDFQRPYGGFIYSYFGETADRNHAHAGLDFVDYGGCYRDPAYATADGVIIVAGDQQDGYGNCVIIDHGNGIKSLYAHFDTVSVAVGDVVKAGDEVGKIGNTGNSTGNHLHFEIMINGVSIDPLIYFD